MEESFLFLKCPWSHSPTFPKRSRNIVLPLEPSFYKYVYTLHDYKSRSTFKTYFPWKVLLNWNVLHASNKIWHQIGMFSFAYDCCTLFVLSKWKITLNLNKYDSTKLITDNKTKGLRFWISISLLNIDLKGHLDEWDIGTLKDIR